jgi:endonuclease-3
VNPKQTAKEQRRKAVSIRTLMSGLRADYPDATCSLRHENALQLLVATVLSAQCTDERVNIVTRSLFEEYRTARDYAQSPPGKLEQEIRSTGFFNSKARSIRGLARAIIERYGGEVPGSMEELLTLPGVARKTANVVLGNAFDVAAGITVDTHVLRLSQRMGLSQETTPVKVEQDLMALVPRRDWVYFGHAMIQHGRNVCQARKPACALCRFRRTCPGRQGA